MPEITGGYRHLTYDDRCETQRMLGAGESVSPVARSLGRNVSSITREIVRNRRDDGYRSTPAAMVRLCTHVRTCGLKGICPPLLHQALCELQQGALHQHLPALRP
jgi:IS30 family transposase